METYKLPKYFKIVENLEIPLVFRFYDERKPEELSDGFNNLKSLVN